MLESSLDQGIGLRYLGDDASPRLVTMVYQGNRAAELPLLWQLCEAMEGSGYPVAVLDATAMESAATPGLQGMIDTVRWQESPTSQVASASFTVLPAAQGLSGLMRTAGRQEALHRIGDLFANHGVVVIYASSEMLTRLMGNSAARPLLTVAQGKDEMVTAYGNLKQLVVQARLLPTVVTLTDGSGRDHMPFGQIRQRLAHCARTYLGFQLDILNGPAAAEEGSNDVHPDARALALRLLENAVALRLSGKSPEKLAPALLSGENDKHARRH